VRLLDFFFPLFFADFFEALARDFFFVPRRRMPTTFGSGMSQSGP
jgi:hypothetical protein